MEMHYLVLILKQSSFDLYYLVLITEKQLKYLRFDFKNSRNLGKLYFLNKIHKRVSKVPGTPVISKCGTFTEKVSEFLDNQL